MDPLAHLFFLSLNSQITSPGARHIKDLQYINEVETLLRKISNLINDTHGK